MAQEQFQSKSFTLYLTTQWGFLSIGSSLLRPLGSFLNHLSGHRQKRKHEKSLSLSLSLFLLMGSFFPSVAVFLFSLCLSTSLSLVFSLSLAIHCICLSIFCSFLCFEFVQSYFSVFSNLRIFYALVCFKLPFYSVGYSVYTWNL